MGSAPLRVLVIDDDQDVRDAVADTLESNGFAVSLAATGEEGLERLRTGPRPNAILLDLLLPGMDGTEFLSRLRSDPAFADIPVAIATGLASAQLRRLLAAQAYLFKPYDGAEMCRQLVRICTAGPQATR